MSGLGGQGGGRAGFEGGGDRRRGAPGRSWGDTWRVSYESPEYEVERRMGEIEIRRYEPYVVAETCVSGSLERAGTGAFRRLAGYIFGGNSTVAGESTKIAMTTPVTQERVGDEFRVRFMMPSSYDLETLPTPNDDRVMLERVDAQRLAAIRYRGRWSKAGYERHLEALEETLAANGVPSVGEPIWARYDPPWTPWFLRRNEVLIAVDEPSGSAS